MEWKITKRLYELNCWRSRGWIVSWGTAQKVKIAIQRISGKNVKTVVKLQRKSGELSIASRRLQGETKWDYLIQRDAKERTIEPEIW